MEKLEELRNLSTKHIYQDQEDLTGVLKNLTFCKTDKNKFKIVGNIYRPPGNIVKDSADKKLRKFFLKLNTIKFNVKPTNYNSWVILILT